MSTKTGIGENSLDTLVMRIYDLGRCVRACDRALSTTYLEARQELADGWNVGECVRTCRRCHGQRTQLTRFDMLDRRGYSVTAPSKERTSREETYDENQILIRGCSARVKFGRHRSLCPGDWHRCRGQGHARKSGCCREGGQDESI